MFNKMAGNREQQANYSSDNAAYASISEKLGCTRQTLRAWCIQAERDAGERPGLSTADKARIRELERGNKELRTANEILRKASAFFCPGGARPPVPRMTAVIDGHREDRGVEPICRILQIAPSTYRARAAAARDPERASERSRRDAESLEAIKRVHDRSQGRYGVRKVWRQLRREEQGIARRTVERLMKKQGLQGVPRGKKRTAIPDPALPCPRDRADRKFRADAPDRLRVADFTHVQTGAGTAYAAFVIDVFARKIVGWSVPTSMATGFVLDALD